MADENNLRQNEILNNTGKYFPFIHKFNFTFAFYTSAIPWIDMVCINKQDTKGNTDRDSHSFSILLLKELSKFMEIIHRLQILWNESKINSIYWMVINHSQCAV